MAKKKIAKKSKVTHVIYDAISELFIEVLDNKLKEAVIDHIEKKEFDEWEIDDFNSQAKIYKVSEAIKFEVVNKSIDFVIKE